MNEALSALQKEYREYFRFYLDKYGVKSPSKLSETEKKKFFMEIAQNWTKGKGPTEQYKKDKEKMEEEDYKHYKKEEMKESIITSFDKFNESVK